MSAILQPALIIGVGGSGTEIVRRFKRRFQAAHSSTPYVRFMGIDTAPQTPESEMSPRLTDDEFVHTTSFRMEYYVSPGLIDQHPTIRTWWRGYDALPPRFVSAGAGMKRPIGRLAFFVNYVAIQQRIEQQLNQIFSSGVFFELPEEYRKAVNVYIVSSTCGGTGTGMFLDLAYMTSHIVANRFGKEPWVRGLLLLPSVFLGTGVVPEQNARNLHANAYGALTELDFAMSKHARLGPIQYPQGPPVSRATEPFKSCYLVGSQAAAGAVFTDFEDILERSAVHVLIELASPLSQQGAAAMDNVLQAIAVKPDAQGRRRLYSSFNGDWLELPSARVISRWTKRLADETLDRLRKPADPDKAKAALQQLGNTTGYGSMRNLFSAQGIKPHLPRVEAFLDTFLDVPPAGAPPDQLIQRAQALQSEAQRQISGNSQLADTVKTSVEVLFDEVEAATRRVIAEDSLEDAKRFVVEVRSEVAGWRSRAQQEVGGAGSDQWLLDFVQKVTGHKKGLLVTQGQFVNVQRQTVVDAAENARRSWSDAVRARIAEHLDRGLPGVLALLDDMRDRLQQAINSVDGAMAIVKKLKDPELAPGVGAQAVSDSEIDDAFSSDGRSERLTQALREPLRGLFDRSNVDPQALAQKIVNACHRAVLQVAPAYLGTLSIPAAAIAKRVDKASPLAVFTPLWPTQPYANDMERVWMVGLPSSMRDQISRLKDELSPELRPNTQVLALNEEDQVIITVQNHGFPLYALQETEESKRNFDTAPNDDKLLCFVQPEPQIRQWDYMPVSPADSVQWFALALATGRIRRAGQSYLFNLGTPTSMDVPLGTDADPVQARQASRDSFLNAGYASDIRRLIGARLQAEGNQRLHAELSSWVEAQNAFRADPAFPSDFVKEIEAVREYLNSIPPY
jgi:hypothetical protein